MRYKDPYYKQQAFQWKVRDTVFFFSIFIWFSWPHDRNLEAPGSYVGFQWQNFTCRSIDTALIECTMKGIRPGFWGPTFVLPFEKHSGFFVSTVAENEWLWSSKLMVCIFCFLFSTNKNGSMLIFTFSLVSVYSFCFLLMTFSWMGAFIASFPDRQSQPLITAYLWPSIVYSLNLVCNKNNFGYFFLVGDNFGVFVHVRGHFLRTPQGVPLLWNIWCDITHRFFGSERKQNKTKHTDGWAIESYAQNPSKSIFLSHEMRVLFGWILQRLLVKQKKTKTRD